MTQGDMGVDSAALQAELEELMEERRRQLARPMRGAVRWQLRRRFDRAEERLRAGIAEVADTDGKSIAAPMGVED